MRTSRLLSGEEGRRDRALLFDEIQAAPGWEPFVDRLLRTERCQVRSHGMRRRNCCRGRSSRSRSGSTSTTGGSMAQAIFRPSGASRSSRHSTSTGSGEAFPRSPDSAGICGSGSIRSTSTPFCFGIWSSGTTSPTRGPCPILAHRLVDDAASLYTVNSLTGYLKSLGHKVPKASVSEYLEWFEDAYFLFTVRIFDASAARRNANPKKVYCIDHALITSVASGILVNSGHLLENLVFTALRRRHPEIHYYRTRTGREVDFVVPRRGRQPMLVQACESLADPRTRKRETAALVSGDGRVGRPHVYHRHPQRAGADQGRRRGYRGGAGLEVPARHRSRRRLSATGLLDGHPLQSSGVDVDAEAHPRADAPRRSGPRPSDENITRASGARPSAAVPDRRIPAPYRSRAASPL